MGALASRIDGVAAGNAFSGVVRVDRAASRVRPGLRARRPRPRDRRTRSTRGSAIASGAKGLTALAVVSLVEDGVLELATTRAVGARRRPAADRRRRDRRAPAGPPLRHRRLPRRGAPGDDVDRLRAAGPGPRAGRRPRSTSRCSTGTRPQFPPGERFAYCNGGYVVLALIAERASGVPFHDLVRQRVCEPAGMGDTAFLRSDELAGARRARLPRRSTALRTNVFHLPVRGSGDGGIYSTVADISALWRRPVRRPDRARRRGSAEMVRPRSDVPAERDALRARLLAARDRRRR